MKILPQSLRRTSVRFLCARKRRGRRCNAINACAALLVLLVGLGSVEAATVSGTVTERDGGAEITGATVCVFRTDGTQVGDCATTDGNGDYQATNVPAESDLVALAEASGFAGQFHDDVVIHAGYDAATPIDVSSSDETGIDFALDEAGTLEGVVTDADTMSTIGTGIVTLLDTSGGHLFDAAVNIQPDGSYSHVDVAPGDYLIAFTARDAMKSYIDEIHDDVLCPDLGCDTAGLGTPVTINAGATTTVDAELQVGSVVSGTVYKSDGPAPPMEDPITDGQVTILDPVGNFAGAEPIAGDGSYELLPVPDGDYTLLFRAAGTDSNYIAELYDDIPCPLGGCFFNSTPNTFTINGSDMTIDESLDPGHTVSGSVTDADTGSDVPGQVSVFEPDGTHLGSVPIDTGTYTTDGLPSGDYKLQFRGFGGGSAYIDELYDEIPCEGFCDFSNQGQLVTVSGSDVVKNEELETGHLIKGQVTDQGSGALLTRDVSAVVFDTSGDPVARVNVDGNGMYAAAVPDGDYFVWFDTFGVNNGYIDEVHQDVPCPDQSCDVTAVGTEVTVSGGDLTIDAALAQAGRISGTVSKASNGNPITSGHVELLQPDGNAVLFTNIDINGNYDFGGVPDSDYLLFFVAQGADSAFIDELYDEVPCPRGACDIVAEGTTITVSGSPLTIDEELMRGNVIDGTIEDAANPGAGIPAGAVQIFDTAGDALFSQPYSGGTFELDGLPDGDYLLHFSAAPDGNDGWIGEFYDDLACPALACDFVASANELALSADTTLAIDLAPGTPVEGTVTAAARDSSGLGAGVQFLDAAGNHVATTFTTDSNGNYSIALPDGEYRALAFSFDHATYIPELYAEQNCPGRICDVVADGDPIILSGTTQMIHFTLEQGSNITGRVTETSSGSGLEGVQVCIVREASPTQNVACAFSDSNGDYVSPALLGGDYKVFTNAFDIDGVVDEVYDNHQCRGSYCDIAAGDQVTVGSPGDATGIDFPLDPGIAFQGQVVDSTNGDPLDNVAISVWEATTGDTNFVGNATTDANGMFSIDGLIAGDYAMLFERDNYITQFFDGNTAEGETPPYCPDFTCFGFPGPTVNVPASGLTDLEVDMDPGARVTGTILGPDGNPVTAGFGGVRVRVFDESGEPAGTPFIAPQPSGRPGEPTYTAELPPGTWHFLFETSDANLGLVDTAFGGQPCPRGSCGMTTTNPIEVSAGDELTGFNGQLSEGAQLQGELLEDDGSGAPLPALPEFTTIYFYDADGDYASFGLADANGDFLSWTGLPEGTYYAATVWDFGTALQSGSPDGFIDELYDDNPCVGGCDFTAGQPVEVTTSDIGGLVAQNIVVALSQGGSIAGVVTDESATPIADATVRLFDAVGDPAGTQTTDGTGAYTFDGLPPDDYYLVTDNDAGLQDEAYQNEPCEPSCNPLNANPVTLSPGGSVTAIDFSLAAAASLAGRVTDDTGGGLEGVDVEVYNNLGTRVETAVTDAGGDWQVGNLAAGDHFLRTRNDDGLRDEAWDDLACSGCDVTDTVPVSLMPGQQATGFDFQLILAGGIAGNVSATMAPGDDSLAGVTVEVFTNSGDPVASDTTDTDGNWSVTGLAEGDYHVVTESSIGYVDEAFDNVVCEPGCVPTAGSAITVATTIESADFELVPVASVAGTVSTDTGQPVADVTVQAFDATGALLGEAVTSPAGGYTIGGLPDGDAFLRTASGGSFTDQVYDGRDCTPVCDVTNGDPVTLSPGADVTGRDFSLVPGGSISGHVADAGDNDLASVDVRVFNAAGAEVATVATDANGNYTIQGLVDGDYFVRTDNDRGFIDEFHDGLSCTPEPCGVTQGMPITIDDGAAVAGIEFQLAPGSSLGGDATDPFGNPLPDGEVVLFDDQGRELRRTGIVDGAWSFSGVADGAYHIVVLNGSGLVDELYEDIACPGASCDVTTGAVLNVPSTRAASRAAANQTIGFQLSPGSRIRGRIDGPGGGIPGARVFFFDAEGELAGSTLTDAAGSYESDSAFPAGDYFVATASGEERGVGADLVNELYGGQPCPLDCDVTTGTPVVLDGSADATGIDFMLEPGGALSGAAIDDRGNPLTGARIAVFDATGVLAGQTTVDSLGQWRLDGLPDGDYTVVMETPLQPGFEDVVLGAGACSGGCDPETGQTFTVTAPNETGGVDFLLFPADVLFRSSFEPLPPGAR